MRRRVLVRLEVLSSPACGAAIALLAPAVLPAPSPALSPALAAEHPATIEATASARYSREAHRHFFSEPQLNPVLTSIPRIRSTVLNDTLISTTLLDSQALNSRSPDWALGWEAASMPAGFANIAIAATGNAAQGKSIG